MIVLGAARILEIPTDKPLIDIALLICSEITCIAKEIASTMEGELDNTSSPRMIVLGAARILEIPTDKPLIDTALLICSKFYGNITNTPVSQIKIGMCNGLDSSDFGYPSSCVCCDCMQHAYGEDPEQRWPEYKPELR